MPAKQLDLNAILGYTRYYVVYVTDHDSLTGLSSDAWNVSSRIVTNTMGNSVAVSEPLKQLCALFAALLVSFFIPPKLRPTHNQQQLLCGSLQDAALSIAPRLFIRLSMSCACLYLENETLQKVQDCWERCKCHLQYNTNNNTCLCPRLLTGNHHAGTVVCLPHALTIAHWKFVADTCSRQRYTIRDIVLVLGC